MKNFFETKRDSPLSSHFGWVGIGTPGTVLFVPAGRPVPAAAPCCPAGRTVPVTIRDYLESGKPAQQGVLPYSVSVHLFIRLNSGYNNPIRPQRKLVIRYLQLIKKACPTGNVILDGNKRPEWSGNCIQCLACISRCPMGAIVYAKDKKPYFCPKYR